jgi:hypothetical protein
MLLIQPDVQGLPSALKVRPTVRVAAKRQMPQDAIEPLDGFLKSAGDAEAFRFGLHQPLARFFHASGGG